MSAVTGPSNPESHFDRGARLTLAFVAVFSLIVLAATYYVLASPVDGWQIPYSVPDPPPLAYFAGDWPTPLRAGDRVIAVDGTPVPIDSGLVPLRPPPGWRAGGTVRYSVQRDGQPLDLDVTLHQLDARGMLRSVWHTMRDTPMEWSWSLIAILVFLLRPGNSAARLLFVAGVAHSVVTKVGWAATMIGRDFVPAPIYYSYQLTASFWVYLFFPSIILLALRFPLRIFPLTRWPRALPALLYGLPLALTLTLLTVATGSIEILTGVLASEAILILLASGAAFLNARKLRHDPVARAQTMWFVFGFALTFAPLLFVYVLTYRGFLPDTVFARLQYSVSTLALPVCLAVAITRYHLFDIDVIINRTIVYVTLTAIVAGIFSAAIALSQKVFVALTGTDSLGSTLVATLIVVAVFNPIKDRVQRLVDKRFKEVPSATKRLNAFEEQLRTRVWQVDVSRITRRFLEEAVAAFDAEGGVAYLDERGSLSPIYTAGEWKGDERISVPVESSGARIGCIALGLRRHGRDYADSDRKTLEHVAQVVGQAIEEDGGLQRSQNRRPPELE